MALGQVFRGPSGGAVCVTCPPISYPLWKTLMLWVFQDLARTQTWGFAWCSRALWFVCVSALDGFGSFRVTGRLPVTFTQICVCCLLVLGGGPGKWGQFSGLSFPL